jgi:hypothetical protein
MLNKEVDVFCRRQIDLVLQEMEKKLAHLPKSFMA